MIKDEDGNYYFCELDKNVTLWFRYIPVYHQIMKNPIARREMRDDPGVKFMRKGYRIFYSLLFLLLLIATIYK